LRANDEHDLCSQLLVAALHFRGKLIRGQLDLCGQLVVGGFELGDLFVARGLNDDLRLRVWGSGVRISNLGYDICSLGSRFEG